MASHLDENFFYNSMLAKAVVTLSPPNERKILRLWFDKLLDMDKSVKEKEIRNDIMWFILLMLQARKIREPFNKIPPTDIGELRDIVTPKVYEEVLVANDENVILENVPEGKKANFQQSAPAQFYSNQPIPKEGIVCYMSVFSDRDF